MVAAQGYVTLWVLEKHPQSIFLWYEFNNTKQYSQAGVSRWFRASKWQKRPIVVFY